MKIIYIVNRIDTGEHGYAEIERVFDTKEKAELYKIELDKKYKDNISFQYKHFFFEVDEISVF